MKRIRATGLVLSIASAVACSSVQPPHNALAGAERAIGEAQQLDARSYARLELHLAQEHLEQAQAAVRDEKYEKARELAEKAEVEAKLALAKRNAGASEKTVAELKSNIEALRSELARAALQR